MVTSLLMKSSSCYWYLVGISFSLKNQIIIFLTSCALAAFILPQSQPHSSCSHLLLFRYKPTHPCISLSLSLSRLFLPNWPSRPWFSRSVPVLTPHHPMPSCRDILLSASYLCWWLHWWLAVPETCGASTWIYSRHRLPIDTRMRLQTGRQWHVMQCSDTKCTPWYAVRFLCSPTTDLSTNKLKLIHCRW